MACQGVFTMRCTAPACSASRVAAAARQHRSSAGLPPARRQQQKAFRVAAVLTAEASELDVSKMAPLGDRLLVKPKEQEAVTAGGILLAGGSKPSMQEALIGQVVAVGEDVDIGVAKGDTVLFSKYSSSDVDTASGEICFVAQRSILAKLS